MATDWERSFGEKVPLVYTDLQGVNANHRFIVGHRGYYGPVDNVEVLLFYYGVSYFCLYSSFHTGLAAWSPLNTWQWFLLLAGLAQHHPLSWLICILWFVAFLAS